MVFEHTLHRYGQEVTQFKPTFVSINLTFLSVMKKTQQQSEGSLATDSIKYSTETCLE